MEYFNADAVFDISGIGGVPTTRDGLQPFGNFTTEESVTVNCLIDRPLQLERGSTIFMFDPKQDNSFGLAYIRFRKDELVLSNVDLGERVRAGIGTCLVKILLDKFPSHKIRGEQPNPEALKWHASLEQKFGDRMIPFTQDECDKSRRFWGSESN